MTTEPNTTKMQLWNDIVKPYLTSIEVSPEEWETMTESEPRCCNHADDAFGNDNVWYPATLLGVRSAAADDAFCKSCGEREAHHHLDAAMKFARNQQAKYDDLILILKFEKAIQSPDWPFPIFDAAIKSMMHE